MTKREKQTCKVLSIVHLSGKYMKLTACDGQLALADKLSGSVINRTDVICIKA